MALGRHHTPMPAGGGIHPISSNHFLLSPSLRERLQTCGVDKFGRAWEHTSDHAPVWIELDDD